MPPLLKLIAVEQTLATSTSIPGFLTTPILESDVVQLTPLFAGLLPRSQAINTHTAVSNLARATGLFSDDSIERTYPNLITLHLEALLSARQTLFACLEAEKKAEDSLARSTLSSCISEESKSDLLRYPSCTSFFETLCCAAVGITNEKLLLSVSRLEITFSNPSVAASHLDEMGPILKSVLEAIQTLKAEMPSLSTFAYSAFTQASYDLSVHASRVSSRCLREQEMNTPSPYSKDALTTLLGYMKEFYKHPFYLALHETRKTVLLHAMFALSRVSGHPKDEAFGTSLDGPIVELLPICIEQTEGADRVLLQIFLAQRELQNRHFSSAFHTTANLILYSVQEGLPLEFAHTALLLESFSWRMTEAAEITRKIPIICELSSVLTALNPDLTHISFEGTPSESHTKKLSTAFLGAIVQLKKVLVFFQSSRADFLIANSSLIWHLSHSVECLDFIATDLQLKTPRISDTTHQCRQIGQQLSAVVTQLQAPQHSVHELLLFIEGPAGPAKKSKKPTQTPSVPKPTKKTSAAALPQAPAPLAESTPLTSKSVPTINTFEPAPELAEAFSHFQAQLYTEGIAACKVILASLKSKPKSTPEEGLRLEVQAHFLLAHLHFDKEKGWQSTSFDTLFRSMGDHLASIKFLQRKLKECQYRPLSLFITSQLSFFREIYLDALPNLEKKAEDFKAKADAQNQEWAKIRVEISTRKPAERTRHSESTPPSEKSLHRKKLNSYARQSEGALKNLRETLSKLQESEKTK